MKSPRLFAGAGNTIVDVWTELGLRRILFCIPYKKQSSTELGQ